jgi:RimJ/RimL family protein N-acetyltransferase
VKSGMGPADGVRTIAGTFLQSQACRDALGDTFRFERLGPEHTDAILRWRNDATVVGSFRSAAGLTRDAHERFLADYEGRGRVDLVLVDDTTNTPVGVFYLTGLGTCRPEIGKYVGEMQYRGRGIAKRATRALIAFAFEWLGLNELYAVTRVDNERNIFLNEALGFVRYATETHEGHEFLVMKLTRA